MKVIYIIIAVLLSVDNIFIRFKVGGISYDRLLEFVFFFLFFKAYLNEIRTNPFFKKWNTFLLLFALLQLLVNLGLAISGKMEFEFVYTGLFKCFSFLVFSFLFLFICKKDIRYINIIVFIHFLICVFAFLMHPLSPIASQIFEIKRLLYSSVQETKALGRLANEEVYIQGGFADRFRLSGPFGYSIAFSYFAITSVIINFYMYLRYAKKKYLFFLSVLFIASILTQTRSLILAELCLVFGYLFFAPFKRHGLFKLALVTGALLCILITYSAKNLMTLGNSRITQVNSGGESDSRPLLWITGLYAVANNPFGITSKEYDKAKNDMFRKFGNSDILHVTSHNGLINIGFYYSILGYILFYFLVLFLINYINLLQPKYVVFFRFALISYLVHTSFHNSFILSTDYQFLLVLMLISVDFFHNKTELPALPYLKV